VDPGLDENETELGVLVLAVALKVLSDRDRLLDQHVEILWDFRSKACIKVKSLCQLCNQQEAVSDSSCCRVYNTVRFQDTEDLVSYGTSQHQLPTVLTLMLLLWKTYQ